MSLIRLGLPTWRTEDDLALALGLTRKGLESLGRHYAEHHPHYTTHTIPKRGGGKRTITAPKPHLRTIQRQLLTLLVEPLLVSDAAHGFVKGRSVATNAAPHVGRKVVVKLDLADFFGAVTYPRVYGYLLSMGYGFSIAATLTALMTKEGRVPQGAPTSPGLCNAIVYELDRRLLGLAQTLGFTYTRYADDLTFSGNLTFPGDDGHALSRLIDAASQVVLDEGFRVNDTKTKVMRRTEAQRVTGVTVNQVLGLSRKERRRIRAAIHQHGADPERQDQLRGMVAWVSALNPEQAARLSGDRFS